MANYQRKRKNYAGLIAVIFVMILVLAVAVSAALTQGFTNADPYGWLADAKEKIEQAKEKDGQEEEQEEDAPIEQAYVRDVLGGIYA